MKERKMTQAQKVLKYMLTYGSITPKEAYEELGCMRLSGRIYDLRKSGYNVVSDIQKGKDGSRYARYWVAPADTPLVFLSSLDACLRIEDEWIFGDVRCGKL